MRVAHFSDLHVLALEGVSVTRFLNKRITGWVNLRLKREHSHKPAHVRAVARAVAQAGVDHVVITGDLTNLALEQEFSAVRRLLDEELGMDPRHVTIVPGNHDLYTAGALRARRFTRFFEPYMDGDLPELAADLALGRFPFVKLRGPLAIIGLSSAVPRPPIVAAGELGSVQLEGLERILAHDEVKRRTPLFVLHHPLHNPPSRLKSWMKGLRDAPSLVDAVAGVQHGLLVHGHLHGRIQRAQPTKAGSILTVGATSASLHDEDQHKMAGYNLYEFDGAGRLIDVQAHILEPGTETFRVDSVPKWV
jgi:3',5'-cyclic AMP phosphodiesterase CpdA